MTIRISIVSQRTCVVVRKPGWLLRLLGCQPSERYVVGVTSINGGTAWLYEDSHSDRHMRVEPGIAAEIDRAYARATQPRRPMGSPRSVDDRGVN